RSVAAVTVDRRQFVERWVTLQAGEELDPVSLTQYLVRTGYRLEATVNRPGDINRRGGILDVFPVSASAPVRLDYFGNVIEEIRIFDPQTQRSSATLEQIAIGPAVEAFSLLSATPGQIRQVFERYDISSLEPAMKRQMLADMEKLLGGYQFPEINYYTPLFNRDSILSFLPPDSAVILDDTAAVQWAVENLNIEQRSIYQDLLERNLVVSGFPAPYHSWEDLSEQIEGTAGVNLEDWETSAGEDVIKLDFKAPGRFIPPYSDLLKELSRNIREHKRSVIISHQAERFAEILNDGGIITTPLDELLAVIRKGETVLVKGIIDGGWIFNRETCLYTDTETMGFARQNRQAASRFTRGQIDLERIKTGEYVVHIDHGIARYAGVTVMNNDGLKREYLVLEYGGEDRLYVPVDQIDRVSRYIGASDTSPALDNLGTAQWQKTRQKAKEAVQEVARELLLLYSQREVIPGYSFSGDTIWQSELEASFPYAETPDQLKAIQQIKRDMVRPRPMDRLLLGDVGYGKTEVAVRAAFKAVQDGRQVAVLVPTTLLARQHYITFQERLGAYPVAIESLSRFKNAREQAVIIDKIQLGQIDIIIGTHRLLQKDVEFKDLGLIIIDEEQRFGVKHKEMLKQKRQQVDVLALSATPIPRTLYMSLSGVRDLSTIETPPDERLPIRTYVAEYNPQLIREAIVNEMERNGQVFFVHNRVNSIAMVAERLKALVPEARFGVAHGRMEEEELAAVMEQFTRGDIDVLVCTTIIESGLDVPNANTLIVNRADKLGLIQLHQLRGRVGRGSEIAYAYFVYDAGKILTSDARKRLSTIYELAELGSGFNIAMRDLEIRGAGTLLGTKQSGHMSAVGFKLYTQMLSRAVEEQKALQAGQALPPEKHLPEPAIDLPLSLMLPEDYITDESLRLNIYRRLSRVRSFDELDEMAAELADRFGPLPEEVENLMYAVRIKLLSISAGIASITHEGDCLKLVPYEGLNFRQVQTFGGITGLHVNRFNITLEMSHLPGSWKQALELTLQRGLAGIQYR
ncbi:MAG: transcription-repair coupling factor, partial [Dehalococcoidaceae bacterium]|nr:transcription-repair coupling factor [Dehalococcoidaceae bacterium]